MGNLWDINLSDDQSPYVPYLYLISQQYGLCICVCACVCLYFTIQNLAVCSKMNGKDCAHGKGSGSQKKAVFGAHGH